MQILGTFGFLRSSHYTPKLLYWSHLILHMSFTSCLQRNYGLLSEEFSCLVWAWLTPNVSLRQGARARLSQIAWWQSAPSKRLFRHVCCVPVAKTNLYNVAMEILREKCGSGFWGRRAKIKLNESQYWFCPLVWGNFWWHRSLHTWEILLTLVLTN